MSGKCPKCDQEVATATLAEMRIENSDMRVRAFGVCCPHCRTILGVVRDPQPMDIER